MNTDIRMSWFNYFYAVPAKWRRRTRVERLLLLEAFVLLGIARLTVLALPFKWLSGSLGRHMNEAADLVSASELELARQVGRAVRSAANYTLWESVCLPQAVAAQWMLKRRHIAGTLYLGLAKDEAKTEKLAAHAWLSCGGLVLTGARGHRQYTVVSMFS
ncbi:MAG: lasso peptide biosynthesis B2 protein [Elusimicrobia bacterium]|nr:lasso peptide biosynthesis B2 protein [Elusimicrobiota bacterium]